MTISQAFDHFSENVFPILFEGETRKNKGYKRVYAAIMARQKGKLTDARAQKILKDFAPRNYIFETTVRYVP